MTHSMILPPRTEREIERSITHFDQDYELDFYSRRKMVLDPETGRIEVIKRVRGATLFTGIPTELLYHDQGTASASVTGTAAELVMNLTATMGQPASIPAGFWLPGFGPIGRFAKIVLRGSYIDNGTGGTIIFINRIGATQSITATIASTSGSIATPATAATFLWEQEVDVALQAFGTVAAQSVLRSFGHAFVGQTTNSVTSNTAVIAGGTAAGTPLATGLSAATLDITANNFLSFNQLSSVTNALTLAQAFVYGMG